MSVCSALKIKLICNRVSYSIIIGDVLEFCSDICDLDLKGCADNEYHFTDFTVSPFMVCVV